MPIHPGHVLQDAVGGIDPADVADALGVPATDLQKLFDGRMRISETMAHRLEALLHFKAADRLSMQHQWDEAQEMNGK